MTSVQKVTMVEYPALSKTMVFDIGVAEVQQSYPAPGVMQYKVLTGPRAGSEETVTIEVKELAANLFLVSWQEHDNITVVHVENFSSMTFDSCVTMPNGSFRRFTSRMWFKR